MARVPYLEPDDLPPDRRDLVFRVSGSDETADVFRALANNPPILDSFRKYFGFLWAESGLTDRERELVILAAAREAGSAYEWHQHVRLGRAAGIDDDEIRAVAAGEVDGFDGREARLLRLAAATAREEVDDDVFAAAAEEFDDATLVGVTMLAAGYLGLARAISALGVEVEEAFVGWDLAGG